MSLPYLRDEEPLGAGSFGFVYRGHLVSGGGRAPVAIKVMKHTVQGVRITKQQREDEAIRLLSHLHPFIITYRAHFWVHRPASAPPCCVPFAAAAETDDLWLVQEFAEHGTLQDHLARAPAAQRSALLRVHAAQVLYALQHLASSRLVHRDVTPRNILVCRGAIAKLADFGSVRELCSAVPGGRSTRAAGTLDYMSPEACAQWDRHSGRGAGASAAPPLPAPCSATDVWSLGATLLHLCVGDGPYAALLEGGERAGLLARAQAAREWGGLGADMQGVLAGCLAGRAAERATAAQLLQDSELAGEWLAKAAEAQGAAEAAPQSGGSAEGGGGEVCGSGAPWTARLVAEQRHGHFVTGLCVLDGQMLVSSGGGGVTRLWDARAPSLTPQPPSDARMLAAFDVLADVGRLRLCVVSDKCDATVLDVRSGKALCSLLGQRSVRGLGVQEAVHSAGSLSLAGLPGEQVATGGKDGTVKVWSLAEDSGGRQRFRYALSGHKDWVTALALLSDGRLASGSLDGSVCLWQCGGARHSEAPEAVLEQRAQVHALAALAGGGLAVGCDSGRVSLWDTRGECEHVGALEGHEGCVTALAALPKGMLASGSLDRTVRVWQLGTRACLVVLEGHTAAVRGVVALPGGRLGSACEGEDGKIRVWELAEGGRWG